MKSKYLVTLVLCLVFCVVLFFGCKSKKAAFPEQFSADIKAKADDTTFSGKIYVGKDKIRIDMPESSLISRLDKDLNWLLFHSNKVYIEVPLLEGDRGGLAAGKVSGEKSRKLISKEKVNGRVVGKYKVVGEHEGKELSFYQWVDLDNGVPIKTSSEDGSLSFEYENPKLGSQPEDIFEVPSDFAKMQMPSFPGAVPDVMPSDDSGTGGGMGDFDDVD